MAAHNFIDLTGRRFGRLTVIERVEDVRNMTRWLCKCDCGNQTVVYGNNLRRGFTQSCGCYARELPNPNKTHGECRTRLYRIWSGIHTRCYDPHCKSYERYGARGITECDEWLHSYEAFRDWALKNGYREDLTIDRIDNNKGYCPENCRWATKKEQANNRGKRRWKKKPEGSEINGN